MDSPFANLTELQKTKLFKLLETHTYTFEKNEEILTSLKNNNIICIMLSGRAIIVNIDYNGEEYLLEELTEESVFGTYLSNIDQTDYQIISQERSSVLVIDYAKLVNKQNLGFTYYNIFLSNIFEIVAEKMRGLNNRIKVLSQKTIRNKLLTFFENEYRKTRSTNIILESNLKGLADYLSINRSAMFRELKSLKEENFIRVNGKRISLLYTPHIN